MCVKKALGWDDFYRNAHGTELGAITLTNCLNSMPRGMMAVCGILRPMGEHNLFGSEFHQMKLTCFTCFRVLHIGNSTKMQKEKTAREKTDRNKRW